MEISVLDDIVGTLHVLYQVLGYAASFLPWLFQAEHTFGVRAAHISHTSRFHSFWIMRLFKVFDLTVPP